MYSQYDEEKWILAIFRSDPPEMAARRRFLDIGAWSAITFSNTRALYELGWSGVMIEPSPGPMLGLLKEYGNERRIQLISSAVGWEGKLAEMSVTDDGLSTSVEEHRLLWAEKGGYFGKMYVPVLTWFDIFNQFGGFDFVNIDAEGLSAELYFRLINDTECRPHCICVEHDNRTTEILSRAPQWYNCVYANGTNVVLVRK